MKLVIATPLYPPELGGPATYAKLLEEGLPERGFEVELVKFGDVRHLPKVVRHFVYFLRVRRALARADLALALDPVSTGLPTCIAAWLARKPFVVKVVGDYAWEQGRQRFGVTATLDDFVKTKHVPFAVWFLRTVQSGVVSRAQLVIVPSEYLKGIVTSWGLLAEKVYVIYNAVQQEDNGVVPQAVAALPRPLVVTAGRLVPWKHIEGIIDSVAVIRTHETESSLVVIGEGPEHTALSARAKKALDNNYVFTGALSHKDLLAAMSTASVFVLNSSYEGLSHVLIEALSLGVPIIATDAGGNAEVITDGVDGILVKVGDSAALRAALTRLLSHPELRTQFSTRARESAKRFSRDAMLEAAAHTLRTLITP